METQKKQKSLFANFISYFLGNFGVIVLGLLSTPIITRVLSPEETGRNNMFYRAVTFISIFAIMGLDQAYIRFFYKPGVNQNRLMRQCLLPPLLTAGALSLFYCINAHTFNMHLFQVDDKDVKFLVVLYVFSAVLERFMMLHIRMQQKGGLYAFFNILQKALYIVFIFVVFFFIRADNYRVALYATTLALAVEAFFITVRFLLYLRAGRGAQGTPHSAAQRQLFAYGIPFILMNLVNWALTSMDAEMLNIWGTLSAVGIYAAAMNIINIMVNVKAAFSSFWVPVALERYEHDTEENCHAFFAGVFEKVQLLCVLAALCVILFRKVIVLFLGADYREGALVIIPLLLLMPVMDIMFEITSQGLNFKQQLRYYNYSSVIVLITNLAGNALLIPRFGALGAAAATSLSYVIYFVSGTWFSQRCYRVPYRFHKTAVYVLLLAACAAGSMFYTSTAVNTVVSLAALAAVFMLDMKNIREMAKMVVKLAGHLLKKGK